MPERNVLGKREAGAQRPGQSTPICRAMDCFAGVRNDDALGFAFAKKRKGPKPLSLTLPLVPTVPAATPAAVAATPAAPVAVPAITAAIATPVTVPAAITTPIMRMVVASTTVVMAVPAMAVFVADITGRDIDSRRRLLCRRGRAG